jgi:hypothetical protein
VPTPKAANKEPRNSGCGPFPPVRECGCRAGRGAAQPAFSPWRASLSPTTPRRLAARILQHQCHLQAKRSRILRCDERAAGAGTRSAASPPPVTASSASRVRWACTAEPSADTSPRRCLRAIGHANNPSQADCHYRGSNHSSSTCKVGGKPAAPMWRASSENWTRRVTARAIRCSCKRWRRGVVRGRRRNLDVVGGVDEHE